jgi:hypothetical protein
MILVRYILEIADADFYVGSYSMVTEPVLSWKCKMVAITNVPIVHSTC